MPLTHTHTQHTQADSHMARAECVVLWLPNEIIAAALHPLLGLLAFACVSLCAFVYICVSLCTYVPVCVRFSVCVCYLERLTIAAIINCSQSHFRFFMRFDYFALGLCQFWYLSLSPFSLLPPPPLLVIEYIILLYLPHTHTRERQSSIPCEWHLNINCFVSFACKIFISIYSISPSFPLHPCTFAACLEFYFCLLFNKLFICFVSFTLAAASGCACSLCHKLRQLEVAGKGIGVEEGCLETAAKLCRLW